MHVQTHLDRDKLVEVVLVLKRKIISNKDESRTSQLKRMLTHTKQIYKELSGNYEGCKN